MSKAELTESLAIVFAALALIPFAFGYRTAEYKAFLRLALVLMLVVAVRRIVRISSAGRK